MNARPRGRLLYFPSQAANRRPSRLPILIKESSMHLLSPAFQNEGEIPTRFTCEGDNISPELSWQEAPKETESFVLILHDPDAPRRNGFTHWILYDIPSSINRLRENVPKEAQLADTGRQGRNDSGEIGYTGPCPPSGRHRYFARLYALREKLNLPVGANATEVQNALQGKVIEQAELMATYQKLAKGRSA
jgi:Raf kinase inhibitor-like YbhB/YbcL family protein